MTSPSEPGATPGQIIVGTERSDYRLQGGDGPDLIDGLGGYDVINGMGGDDTIIGGDGGGSYDGGDGNDSIQGGDNSTWEWLRGGAGDDTLDGAAGDDALYGDDGNDSLLGGTGNDTLSGGSGDDVLMGEAGDDRLDGDEGDDTLNGGHGNDVLIDTQGSNRLVGGAGDDTFGEVSSHAGQNALLGGAGRDTYRLGAVLSQGTSPDVVEDFEAGSGGDVIDIDGIRSTLGFSYIAVPNLFATGHLKLVSDGTDTLLKASMTGGADPDDLTTILVLRGLDPSSLTADNFLPVTAPVTPTTVPTGGDDALRGTPDNDFYDGGAGNDTIMGYAGDDLLSGGEGNDFLYGGEGSDTLMGGSGDDRLESGEGVDVLIGGSGNDSLLSEGGDNVLDGGSGDDYLSAGAGDDILSGGDGNDDLWGGAGDDVLSGGAGDDKLYGNAGYNILRGGDGGDQIWSEGANTIEGGAGSDVYRTWSFVEALDNPDVFKDFEVGFGGDVLDLEAAISSADPRNETEHPWLLDPLHPFTSGLVRVVGSGSDTLVQVNLEWLGRGQGYGTFLRLENVAPEQLTAYNFKPAHDPFGRPQTAVGTEAGDTMEGSLADDDMSGLGGNDVIRGSDGNDRIDGGDGNDTLYGGLGGDTILGGAGDDHIEGDPEFWGGDRWSPEPKPGGNDYIDGGDGNDHFSEWRGGSNTIVGGAGDDVFHYVSSGAEWSGYEYWPDYSFDILTGGEGRDTYILGDPEYAAADMITDFEAGPGGDILDINGLLARTPGYHQGRSPFQTGELVLVQDGPDALLRMPAKYSPDRLQTVLTLKDTRVSDLTHDNFVPPYDPSGKIGDVTGTAGSDILDGTALPEYLDGLDGDDILRGHGGDDYLAGGSGNDRAEGGPGSDFVRGDDGDDQVSGGSGDDRVYGDAGNDRIQGDNGNDFLDGGLGDDLIMEVEGHHANGPNDDWLWGQAGNDTLWGGAGNDRLDGGYGNDELHGGTGNDSLTDYYGSNRLFGGLGDDTFHGVSSNWDYGGRTEADSPGVDALLGGPGTDRFVLSIDPARPMVVDRILDFETGPGGDVIELSSVLERISDYVQGTDPFDAGILRLEASDDGTLLQARISQDGFSTILSIESVTPESFTADNFDTVL